MDKETFWEGFWELFKESVIIQSLLTLVVIAIPAVHFLVTGSMAGLPDWWTQLTTLIVGYWFGAKGTFQAVRTNKETLSALKETTRAFAEGKRPPPGEPC